MAKELVAIVLSCAVYGSFFVDAPHCFSVTTLAWMLPSLKVLPRKKLFFVATFDIHIVTEYIAGTNNCRADMLSRNNITRSLLSNPLAKPLPTPLPQLLLCIISPQGPDWMSSSFRQCFTDTITMVSPLLQEPLIPPTSQVI